MKIQRRLLILPYGQHNEGHIQQFGSAETESCQERYENELYLRKNEHQQPYASV